MLLGKRHSYYYHYFSSHQRAYESFFIGFLHLMLFCRNLGVNTVQHNILNGIFEVLHRKTIKGLQYIYHARTGSHRAGWYSSKHAIIHNPLYGHTRGFANFSWYTGIYFRMCARSTMNSLVYGAPQKQN